MNKGKSLLIVLSVVLAAAACNQKPSEESKDSKESATISDNDPHSLAYHLKDSLIIDALGQNFENRTVLVHDDTGSFNLSVFKTQNGALMLYNIDKKESRQLGQFPKKKTEFFLAANNLLYAWTKQKTTVQVYSLSPDWKFKLSDSLFFSDHGSDKRYTFWGLIASDIPFAFNSKNEMVLQIYPNLYMDKDTPLYFQVKNLGLVQMKGDSMVLKDEFAAYPQAYRDKFIGGNDQFNYCFKNDTTVAYIFQDAPIVYEYNLNTKQTSEKHIEGLPQNEMSKYDLTQSSSFQYDVKFGVENDWYVKLLYDKKLDRYFLFRVRKMKQMQSNGKLAEWADKPFDIYVINSSYKVSASYSMASQKKYFLHRSFVYNGYVYLIREINNNKEPLIIDKYEI